MLVIVSDPMLARGVLHIIRSERCRLQSRPQSQIVLERVLRVLVYHRVVRLRVWHVDRRYVDHRISVHDIEIDQLQCRRTVEKFAVGRRQAVTVLVLCSIHQETGDRFWGCCNRISLYHHTRCTLEWKHYFQVKNTQKKK